MYSYITLAITVLVGIFNAVMFCFIRFNDLRHLEISVRELKTSIEKNDDKIDKLSDKISKVEGIISVYVKNTLIDEKDN